MDSSVRPRPTHYEVLGLAPSASEAEIKRAFASRMSLFGAHRPAEVPQISTAFETLRDPAKRRDYDRSLGLTEAPRRGAQQWGFTVSPPRWTPFMAATPTSSARPAPPEPQVAEQPPSQPEAIVDPRLAQIAASLRELARPVENPPAEHKATEEGPEPKPEKSQAPPPVEFRTAGQAYPQFEEDRPSGFEWKRPAVVVGGLIAGAGVIGLLAGFSVKDEAAAQAEPALSVALPAATPRAEAAARPSAAAVVQETVPAAVPAARAKRGVAPQRPSGWAEQMAQSLSQDGETPDVATEQTAADPAPAKLVAASLPLPDRVVARTIERIGYSCGSVASTEAGETPGTFTVNCTSGRSFQAKPVGGRYHFRRLGGR